MSHGGDSDFHGASPFQGLHPHVHDASDFLTPAFPHLTSGFLALLSPVAGAGPIPGGVEPPMGDNKVGMSPRSPPPSPGMLWLMFPASCAFRNADLVLGAVGWGQI